MEHSFVQSLSPMSKHYRFFGGIAALSDRMLDKFTHTHYPDNVAIIATVMENDTEEEIGVARYATTGESTADCAVAVANAWQGRGVATRLLQRLMTIARQAGVTELVGMVLRDNREMLALACHLGFVIRREEDASIIRVSRRLVRDISGVDDSRHADA